MLCDANSHKVVDHRGDERRQWNFPLEFVLLEIPVNVGAKCCQHRVEPSIRYAVIHGRIQKHQWYVSSVAFGPGALLSGFHHAELESDPPRRYRRFAANEVGEFQYLWKPRHE